MMRHNKYNKSFLRCCYNNMYAPFSLPVFEDVVSQQIATTKAFEIPLFQ